MAGDAVSILGKSVWNNTGTTPSPYPLSNVLLSFLTSFVGTTPVTTLNGDALTGSTLYNTSTTTGPLSTLLSNSPTQSDPTVAPKAGINWILFNDQFVPVSMGTDLVSSTGNVVKSHSDLNIPMTSNGYLYVYASNESNIDVFFDNLQVVQTRGPILEETHYYPVGLVMAGISDRSWNKMANFYHFQGQEMQNKEFSNGTGLEEHDFNARFYDQQIGRWHNPDPDHQFANPYMAMANSWPNGIDPTGKTWLGNLIGSPWTDLEIIGGLFAYNNKQSFGRNLFDYFSRFTWQFPQESFGLQLALDESNSGLVNKVSYFNGATVLNTSYLINSTITPTFRNGHSASAFTLGSFINGPSGMQASPNDPTFVHEYGRYLQSQAEGPAYLVYDALPNWYDAVFKGTYANNDPSSRDANARAFIYFTTNYGGLSSYTYDNSPGTTGNANGIYWDFTNTVGDPISGYDPGAAINSPANQSALNFNMRNFW
jgi:RHS repeat-associated protein